MKTDHVKERRKFISDAFHTLNQPLTGLHCGLELSLQKPRTEGEYRQRIGTCVEYASEILALIRAVRQLVDSADPGEQFGTISLGIVLAQVKSEVEVVAEATGVRLEMDCDSAMQVKADPMKLAAALGGVIALQMESLSRGASVQVLQKSTNRSVDLRIVHGPIKNTPANATSKLAEIRRNAAVSYLWTLGAKIESSPNEMRIKLPMLTGYRQPETTKRISS
jgi:light-regulated signal transduction histidine kinase (bacteriophytochrome)